MSSDAVVDPAGAAGFPSPSPSSEDIDWGIEEATDESEVFRAFTAAAQQHQPHPTHPHHPHTNQNSQTNNKHTNSNAHAVLECPHTPPLYPGFSGPNTPSMTFGEFISGTYEGQTADHTDHEEPFAPIQPRSFSSSSSSSSLGSLSRSLVDSVPPIVVPLVDSGGASHLLHADLTPAIHGDSFSDDKFRSPPTHTRPGGEITREDKHDTNTSTSTSPMTDQEHSHPTQTLPTPLSISTPASSDGLTLPASSLSSSLTPPPAASPVPSDRVSVSAGLHMPMSMIVASAADTPAAVVPTNATTTTTAAIDIPLFYSSQYSPSAASRRLASTSGITNAPIRTRSRSTSPHTADHDTQSIGQVPSMVNQPRGSFLSNLFGWSSSASSTSDAASSSTTKATSISLPATPVDGTQSIQTLPPYSTTNTSRRTHHKSGSTSSTLVNSASQPSLTRAQFEPVTATTHPLHVYPVTLLNSAEYAALRSYSIRLKSSLESHESKIAKLQSAKKRYQLSRNEETAMWNKFAISSLVSIASSLYHTHLLHCSTQLQLEFGFTAELSQHLNQVQLVLDGRGSLEKLVVDIETMWTKYLVESESTMRHAPQIPLSTTSTGLKAAAAVWERKQKEWREMKKRSGRRESLSLANAVVSSPPNPSQPSVSSISTSSLKSTFLSTFEIEHLFWPSDGTLLEEQIVGLTETAAKLEATYSQMQRKALAQSDSKQTRMYRLHSIVVKHGLDLIDADEEDETGMGGRGEIDRPLAKENIFYIILRSEASKTNQLNFNTFMLDQRTDEGKMVQRWLDQVNVSHALLAVDGASEDLTSALGSTMTGTSLASATTPATVDVAGGLISDHIATFIDFLAQELIKRYDLASIERERERVYNEQHSATNVANHSHPSVMNPSGGGSDDSNDDTPMPHHTVYSCLHLLLSRFIFSKLGSTDSGAILRSLSSGQESDLDQWFCRKLSWISTLTRSQLGLNPFFMPIGCEMKRRHEWEWKDGTEEHQNGVKQQTEQDENEVTLPYLGAMRILHRLNFALDTSAPIDLLYLIICAIREVTRSANVYLKQHRAAEVERKRQADAAGSTEPIPMPAHAESLHADNMFPLVLYVVIHSALTSPHYLFGTLSRFLPPDQRNFGTAGYALAMIESAVSHVCDMAKQDIQSPTAAAGASMTIAGGDETPQQQRRTRREKLEGTPPLPSNANPNTPSESTSTSPLAGRLIPPPPDTTMEQEPTPKQATQTTSDRATSTRTAPAAAPTPRTRGCI